MSFLRWIRNPIQTAHGLLPAMRRDFSANQRRLLYPDLSLLE